MTEFLKGVVCHSPDIYLDELQWLLEERCGVQVNASTIWRSLLHSGLTMKRITKSALERNEEYRAAFRMEYGIQYTPQQTIFVDESSFDCCTSICNWAWAPCGRCALQKCFFVRGRWYVHIWLRINLSNIIGQLLATSCSVSWWGLACTSGWRVFHHRMVPWLYWWPPSMYAAISCQQLSYRDG